MCVSRRVDHDTVIGSERVLNDIHQFAFVIGLHYIAIRSQSLTGPLTVIAERRVVLFSVDIRFTDAEHIQIGTVDDQ